VGSGAAGSDQAVGRSFDVGATISAFGLAVPFRTESGFASLPRDRPSRESSPRSARPPGPSRRRTRQEPSRAADMTDGVGSGRRDWFDLRAGYTNGTNQ